MNLETSKIKIIRESILDALKRAIAGKQRAIEAKNKDAERTCEGEVKGLNRALTIIDKHLNHE